MCFGGGGGAPVMPAVVRETPIVDAAKATDEAAQKSATDKLSTSRRRRALSLLATGGAGDTAQPLTGAPVASAGKPTLGA